MSLSRITTSEGKTIVLRRGKRGLTLRAVDQQRSENNVEIIDQEQNQMAFKFQYKGRSYYMAVQGTELKLTEAGACSPANIPTSSQFRTVDLGAGSHHGLKTAVEPNRYISYCEPDTITLSNNKSESLLLSVQKETASGCGRRPSDLQRLQWCRKLHPA